jgi:hypothetical protein
MLRLINAELTAARKGEVGQRTPSRLFDFRAVDSLGIERNHQSLEIVTHQVQLVLIVFVAWVASDFRGGQRKD